VKVKLKLITKNPQKTNKRQQYNKIEIGKKFEIRTQQLLSKNDIKTTLQVKKPYDLLTKNGLRIEVKYSSYNPKRNHWVFNIYRHGVLDESQADFYVLWLEPIQPLLKQHLYIVLPAPVGQKVIKIGPKTLLRGWYVAYINDVDTLSYFEKQAGKKAGKNV
jgi:hypothetical protein